MSNGRVFVWKNRDGEDRRLEGVLTFTFERTHVVFWDKHKMLLAVQSSNIDELREIGVTEDQG